MHRLLTNLPQLDDDDGMTTIEYALGCLTAAAFAGLLLKVVTSSAVQQHLTTLINSVLK